MVESPFNKAAKQDVLDAKFFSVNGQATRRRSSHEHGQVTIKNSRGHFTGACPYAFECL